MLKRFSKNKVHFIYTSDFIIPEVLGFDSSLIDRLRAKHIKDSLLQKKLITKKDISYPYTINTDDLRVLYSDAYIKKIRSMELISKKMHLPHLSDLDYLDLIEFYLSILSGTDKAVEVTLKSNKISINPMGGLHHGAKESFGRFCLLNDIFYSLKKHEERMKTMKVLILDTDYHQGDGNISFLDDFKNVYIISMDFEHNKKLNHKRLYSYYLKDDISMSHYLEMIELFLKEINVNFDFIFFNAGYDIWDQDPLGQGLYNTNDILMRDKRVLNLFKNKMVSWLISGAYSHQSWDLISKSIENYVKKVY